MGESTQRSMQCTTNRSAVASFYCFAKDKFAKVLERVLQWTIDTPNSPSSNKDKI